MNLVALLTTCIVVVAIKITYDAWHRRVADSVRLDIRLDGLKGE